MSPKATEDRASEVSKALKLPRISSVSDNECSVSNPNRIQTQPAGKVSCLNCGGLFWPDNSRAKFCDHDCYSSWRSARVPFVDRFWSKVNKTETCWLWTGATRGNGYGFIADRRVNGRQVRHMAHRFSWSLVHGAIPAGIFVCHHCDVPACVNPSHLFLGTQKQNLADAKQKGRLHGPFPRLAFEARVRRPA